VNQYEEEAEEALSTPLTQPYVRPSSLGVAEFCPRAVELNEQSGISRAAIISTAWHAKLAGNDTLIGELHPEERKEVASWGKPSTAVLHNYFPPGDIVDVELDYDSAEKELHVRVENGREGLLTQGTLDFAWVREMGGRRWAFVADLKRSTWAIPDGPDCLQLAAYGHAYSVLRSCVGYTPGLWSGTDNEWSWGTPVDLTSPDALDIWLRIKRSSRNDYRLKTKEDDKRFVTGAHCGSCYGRQRCPEYAALAVVDGEAAEVSIDSTSAAEWLLKAKAMTELAERITDNVKVYAERGGVVKDPTTGKVFLPTTTSGRESLDKESLLKDYPDAKKYWRKGKPGKMFSWRKA
jgi:hypothetical protein